MRAQLTQGQAPLAEPCKTTKITSFLRLATAGHSKLYTCTSSARPPHSPIAKHKRWTKLTVVKCIVIVHCIVVVIVHNIGGIP